jgi:nitrogen-specific signal transduction histidine kinase
MDLFDPTPDDEDHWKNIVKAAVHEIRNPLSSLRTSVEILKMNRLDQKQSQKLMAMMNRQIESISGHLDTLANHPATFLEPPIIFHE